MKKVLSFLCLCASWVLLTPAQENLTQYRMYPAIPVKAPIQCDSVNSKGEKYQLSNLLQTPIQWNEKQGLWTIVNTDSTGVLTLEKAKEHPCIYLLTTHVRAENFLKGKLKITSPVRWELFVEGTSTQKKDTTQDSIDSQSSQTVSLSFEPERDYELTFKVLVTAEEKAVPTFTCQLLKDPKWETVACQTGVQMKKRFMLSNTVYGSRVTTVSVSPSGKYLLTCYTHNYAEGRTYTTHQLSETKSGKVLLSDVRDGLRWMPKTDKLYYTVTAPKGNNLILLDPLTLTEELFLKGIPESRFVWSPNEDYLLYFPYENGVEEKGPLKRIVTPRDRIPGSRTRAFISKYDLQTGLSQPLFFGTRSIYLEDISSDGKYILCGISHEDMTQRPFSSITLFQMNLETQAIDTLFSHERFLDGGAYSPDGKSVVLLGSPEAFNCLGKNCGNHPIANDYDKQAYLMDIASKKITPITKDFNPSVDFLQWNRSDNCIYFSTNDEDCRHIYRYNPAQQTFEKLELKTAVTSVFSLPIDHPTMAAYIGQDDHTAGVAYLYDLKKKQSKLIADPMSAILEEIEMGETQPWNFTASDGTTITGKMCLPPHFDPSKKYPLIVYYYGGTTPTEKGISNPYCAQLFASRNYVVYVIQPSGTIGFGQEFSARHVNAWGKRTAEDIIEGTQQFCKEHPFVDSRRIGCIGASYGGFMTQYLQTKTNLFAAAVSHAGISNVTSYWGEGYWGFGYNAVAAADSYPWQNPTLYTQQGSLFNADKINTPLLLLHGTVDTNVPIGESIQLFNALRILGKEVEFITVEGENHFVSDYKKRVLWQNSIMAWFARWLQDRPEWWFELYPERHL